MKHIKVVGLLQSRAKALKTNDSKSSVDGGWGSWTPWSNCNATCGDVNTTNRTRLCNNPLPM